jgi:multidrug efflux system outer membrane protein
VNFPRSTFIIGTALVLAAGCAVGPNYSRPTVPAQSGWKEQPAATNATVLPPEWWRVFNDKGLTSLEAQAVEANQDLKHAVARVAEARALAGAAEADMYPQISAGGGYSRNRISRHSYGAPRRNLEYDDFRSQFDLSYELDIWGRVRRTVEAARADTAAVATDLQVVLLTITADVARNYYLTRSLDAEKRVIEATIELRREAVRLQETRNQAGLINEVDVTRARTELANVEAEFHAITRSRAQLEHALAVLCGQPTETFAVAASPSDIPVPEVPAGLPSSLLERRPDVIEAEQRLEADSARIGVAKAAFFPTVTLTKTAGLASADLGTFLTGGSRFWSIGPSVHIPIFEGRRNEANLNAARARYEQSMASYRGTALNAFREVEDALSDLTTLSSQREAVNRALVSSRDTATLANERYQKGLSSYLEVVDAQRVALQAEREETQLRGQRAVSTILLIKALGGGWERTNALQLVTLK